MNSLYRQENALAEEVADISGEVDPMTRRIERYRKAKKRSREMAAHLEKIGDKKLASRLVDCGSYLLFRYYFTVMITRLVKACFCKKHLLCPLCAVIRSAILLKRYYQRFLLIMEKPESAGYHLQLVTLTVKNGSDLAERFAHLQRLVQVLRQRTKNAKAGKNIKSQFAKVLALVGSYELTNKKRGWHPHFHALVISNAPIDEDALMKEVHEITGDSYIADVAPITNRETWLKSFCEVLKYSMKFSELSLEKNYEAYKVLKGKRLLVSQGLLYGVPDVADLTEAPLENLPYVELLYRYSDAKGYDLERYHLQGGISGAERASASEGADKPEMPSPEK